VIGEPFAIRVAGQADNLGPGIPGQLHGDRPYAPRSTGDNDRVTRDQSDAPHCSVCRGAGHEQGTGLFPRHVRWTRHEMAGLDEHELGLT
jgi:hypothetical protein